MNEFIFCPVTRAQITVSTRIAGDEIRTPVRIRKNMCLGPETDKDANKSESHIIYIYIYILYNTI